jgi:thiol-disulfide isomerase/thioredoxin
MIGSLIVNAEFDLENYVKRDLVTNPKVKVTGVELIKKVQFEEAPDWTLYMFLMKLRYNGKNDIIPERIFINEKANLTTTTLYSIKSRKFLGKGIRPELTADYYDDAHLIAGNKDAKHKLVVFSDPKCPFCQRYVPKIYEDVKAHPQDLALYYYHMPLRRIHPVSDVLVRVMEVLQKDGRTDDAMKMYDLKINIRERNPKVILDAIKKQFNIEVKEEDINKPEIKKAIENDIYKANRAMITGTPTVYLDGKFDTKVTSYKDIIKKNPEKK